MNFFKHLSVTKRVLPVSYTHLDVYKRQIHGKLVEERDAGKAILLVSLELDEVMQLSDRILVIYEGRIVADLDPKTVTVQELGLYMAGSGRRAVQ